MTRFFKFVLSALIMAVLCALILTAGVVDETTSDPDYAIAGPLTAEYHPGDTVRWYEHAEPSPYVSGGDTGDCDAERVWLAWFARLQDTIRADGARGYREEGDTLVFRWFKQ